jgi:hypothetical protein
MSIKKDMILMTTGAVGVLTYQNIKNGNLKKMISKMKNKEVSVIKDLENMM